MTAHRLLGPAFVLPDELPRWLCPPKPPELPGRKVNNLDAMPPKVVEPQGLRDYRAKKRAEHLAQIAAMGLTEEEYIRRQKAAARRRRLERDRKAKKALSPEKKRKKERAAFYKSAVPR